jgi:hypothetical protein
VRAGGGPLLELRRLPGQDPAGQPARGPTPLHTPPQATLPGTVFRSRMLSTGRVPGTGSGTVLTFMKRRILNKYPAAKFLLAKKVRAKMISRSRFRSRAGSGKQSFWICILLCQKDFAV